MTTASIPDPRSNHAYSGVEEDWDDEERRTPTQWLVDVALMPAVTLFAICLLALGITASIWAIMEMVASIISLIG